MQKDGLSIPNPGPDSAKGETPDTALAAPLGAADKTARQTGEFPPVKGLDPAPAIARMANNIALYTSSLGMFCQGIPQYVANMEAALRAGDRTSLHRLAHTIKGLAATMGAPDISLSAAHLERAISKEGSVPDETEFRSLNDALERLCADVVASGMLDGVDVSPGAEQAKDAAMLRKIKQLSAEDNTRAAGFFAAHERQPCPPEDTPPDNEARLSSHDFEEASDTLNTAIPR